MFKLTEIFFYIDHVFVGINQLCIDSFLVYIIIFRGILQTRLPQAEVLTLAENWNVYTISINNVNIMNNINGTPNLTYMHAILLSTDIVKIYRLFWQRCTKLVVDIV